MKQSLQLKLGTQLTMTPQLQQAIKLLQMSTLDLQQEIQQNLESNPLLEVADSNATDGGDSGKDGDAQDTPELAAQSDSLTDDNPFENHQLPDDLPVDTRWEDILPSSAPSTVGADSDMDFDYRNTAPESLTDHLLWQLNLSRLSNTDRAIAVAIIDATDSNGRLTQTLEELHESFDPALDIDLDEVVAVLHHVQQFEPVGVCTLDLQDCLLVQLRALHEETPWRAEAITLIERHMNQIASGDFKQIMRRCDLDEYELQRVMSLIQSLDPLPGSRIGDSDAQYVIPDVYVSKKNGHWVVELNPETTPKLRINNSYASLIKRADDSADNTYLKNNLQEARWFLKSLQSRNETMMKVATCIVEAQQGFLEHGEEAMKPLVLSDIAEAVEMHESTISRVTTQKYMHTPRGVFELKYFFSSHVGTNNGGECSSTAIRAIIKKLVAAENHRKPLSDSKIAKLLEEQGINIARRTIAKYRDALNIPPSNERKRLV
ncbi:MAG: RNA polymerase factor sigma-54 [Gammaproteobacteria bacterium]|nr:MAG: RNA polymerase factor sigma-54 [Gammaproteobacteria bacterium]